MYGITEWRDVDAPLPQSQQPWHRQPRSATTSPRLTRRVFFFSASVSRPDVLASASLYRIYLRIQAATRLAQHPTLTALSGWHNCVRFWISYTDFLLYCKLFIESNRKNYAADSRSLSVVVNLHDCTQSLNIFTYFCAAFCMLQKNSACRFVNEHRIQNYWSNWRDKVTIRCWGTSLLACYS